MSKVVNKELRALKKAISKEIGFPFIGSILDRKHRKPAQKVDVKNADEEVVEKRRRVLKLARKQTLPQLERALEANPYRELIARIITELIDDQAIFGEDDSLYILELGLELARIEDRRPIHQFLLNAIARNEDALGSLDALRQLECPMEEDQIDRLKTITTFITRGKLPGSTVSDTVKQELIDVMNAGKAPTAAIGVPPESRPMKSDSQLIERAPTALGTKGVTLNPTEKNEDSAKFVVLRQWYRLEETVRHRVSAMRGEDVEKHVKEELRERQDWMETVIDLTSKAAEGTEEASVFGITVKNAIPEFRSKMNWKITKYPEVAARIYDVLDSLIELQVPAEEFVKAAIILADSSNSREILEVSQAIAFGDHGENAARYIIDALTDSKSADDLAARGRSDQLPSAFKAR